MQSGFIVFFVSLLLAGICGCGGSSSLVGTWNYTSSSCSIGNKTDDGSALEQLFKQKGATVQISDKEFKSLLPLSSNCIQTSTYIVKALTNTTMTLVNAGTTCSNTCVQSDGCITAAATSMERTDSYGISGSTLTVTEQKPNTALCIDPNALPITILTR